ncbi:FMN-binding protein [Polaribacter sp. SA4-12]|uniref:FMN-binding protein n=1 Tax=Polaribacter sp. SA4-12 TaxID=1312072 RepID=UPI000B3CFD5F|nr:FMN-binding protein [Polaribacter sp. SA4-12]ARV14033.1 FMN-binding protein [Polaribacter sp. SA4-12]
MILKRFFSLSIIGLSFLLFSFTLPTKLLKKVNKEVKSVFEVTDFEFKLIKIEDSINNLLPKRIGNDHLFKIESNSQLIGYAFVDKAASKTDEFDYLILLDKNLIIAKTKVLVYREDYGGEIGSKRWLKQFIGKSSSDTLQYEKDIIPISGATISALSMTKAVNSFLLDLDILHTNKIL